MTAIKFLLAGAACCFALGAQAHEPSPNDQNCFKSKWGADDQKGAVNNITSANVLDAAKLIKRGKSIRMGIETNSKTP
ncbi:MAG: cyclase family protein, partial [Rhizobacter sp.]